MMMRFLSLFLASASAEGADAAMTSMPLLSKGLLVTAAGLAGVFLVLLLFFLTIKLMQKLNK